MGNNKYEELFLSEITRYKDKPIFFWGASLFLKDFLEKYSLDDFNIAGIIDRAPEKWGKMSGKYLIYPANKLEETQSAVVILAIINNSDSIYQNIKFYIDCINTKKRNIILADNIFCENPLENFVSNKMQFVIDNKKVAASYIEGLQVNWLGKNSIIEFHGDVLPRFKNTTIDCGSNCHIVFGNNCYIKNTHILLSARESKLYIGDNFILQGGEIIMGGENNNSIIIGDNCMFSSDICIRSSDGHTLYDNETCKIINIPRGVKIGNHVWMGKNVTVFKNACILDNSVVASQSLVNKVFDKPNLLLGGYPAKIIKENINWRRETTSFFKNGYVTD